jgi:hypothetical protein
MRRGLVLVEGHGEVEAVGNLIVRLWRHLELVQDLHWLMPVRWPGIATRKGVEKACAYAREQNPAVLLLLRDSDEDGACPAVDAPAATRWVASAALPFPAAVVLAHQEFETWFLPSLHRIAGNHRLASSPGIRAGTVPHPNPEHVRGVKEWLSSHSERPYKPTLHQQSLTRLIDCAEFLAAGEIAPGQPGRVSSAGTLGRALGFLAANLDRSEVYPPPGLPERRRR